MNCKKCKLEIKLTKNNNFDSKIIHYFCDCGLLTIGGLGGKNLCRLLNKEEREIHNNTKPLSPILYFRMVILKEKIYYYHKKRKPRCMWYGIDLINKVN